MRRLTTGLLTLALALGGILWDKPWGVLALALCVLAIGFIEMVHLTGIEDRPRPALAWLALSFLVPLGLRALDLVTLAWAAAFAFFVAGVYGVAVAMRREWASPMAACWLGAPVASVVLAHSQAVQSADFSPNVVLLIVGPLWAGDTLALVVGKLLGRHKIAPAVSPGKTWEGALGGAAGAILAAVGIGMAIGAPIPVSVGAGALATTFGLAGDLLESGLKRATGVKDSGGALPGHGGVLDRLDSLLLSAPVTTGYLLLAAPQLFRNGPWP
ncbi:MAG: phosphatidate cytidylyltransferase [Fimbriimonadaceae bacterium]|nr:phosphatidate cytidylyltransferase [Fimbriimonadaceae bacterium]QYK56329.1 MAG: phosphatidate cytidylyltransferase [Fimbriimonadaceae bacterium]